jgi:hypothetical protein
MVRNKILLILAIFPSLVGFSVTAQAAGGSRLRHGVLLRLWEGRRLPEAVDQSLAVDQFLQENRRLLGLVENPQVQIRRTSLTSCALGQRYIYSQFAYGLPIFNAELVLVAKDHTIMSLFNSLSIRDFIRKTARLSSDQALMIARNSTGNGLTDAPPQVELGYSADGDLVYIVQLSVIDPPAAWELWIEAISGEILKKTDRRIFVDGHGQIFDPDPKTALESDTLHDWNNSNLAIPSAAYDTVPLNQLDDPQGGYYYLDGPFVSDSATANRAHEPVPDFFYWRADPRFEEVMVYYHIDRLQRYFQNQLQTYNANNRQQVVNVNGTSEDNSWYSPLSRIITYGSGGVDDAEDADVILHEYGHAVQDDIHPGQQGGHTGAMGEGYGDYLAGSYSLTLNSAFHPEWVFTWDGHNEFWGGRWLNLPYHYPENAWGQIHDSGQLWSAGLMDVWWDIPDRVAWDRIVLQHHFLLGQGPLMEDAAEAILTTELGLYGGLYRSVIVQNFLTRGFISSSGYYPTIATTPLPDTEDTLQTQFEVTAQITSQTPLDPTSLLLFWRAGQGAFNSILLSLTGNPNEYHAFIPGPFNNQTISYYLVAADTLSFATFSPANAPVDCYQFHVGPDFVPPQVVWTDSLGQTIFLHDSLRVRAAATDNIGVQSVYLLWQVDTGPVQIVLMTPIAPDTFQGWMNYSCQTYGQTVHYFVRAVDASTQANMGEGPEQTFTPSTTALLDDFEGALGPWMTNGQWGPSVQYYHTPTHSLEANPAGYYTESNSDTWAQWGDSWDLSGLTFAWVRFWEWHLLQANHDYGRLEVSSDSGPWQSLFEVTGVDSTFRLRQVSLGAFCGGTSHDLRVRFRVMTDDTINYMGWFIDDLSLATSSIVPVAPGDAKVVLPAHFALDPIRPNPFNGTAEIRYQVQDAGYVSLKVYDLSGRLVEILMDGLRQAGEHNATFDGAGLASGLYFVRMQAGNFHAVRKVALIK